MRQLSAKYRQLDIATALRDLASLPGNHLEAIKCERALEMRGVCQSRLVDN